MLKTAAILGLDDLFFFVLVLGAFISGEVVVYFAVISLLTNSTKSHWFSCFWTAVLITLLSSIDRVPPLTYLVAEMALNKTTAAKSRQSVCGSYL